MNDHETTDVLTDLEPQEELGTGWKILAFLIPLAGAIMYFKHKDTNPAKSKSACTAALWGFGFGIAINVIAGLAGAA